MSDIRVRIAPSPTGNLHIGTARTALFNYLFARHHGAKMILRIEDTDLNRSTEESLNNIIEGLKWLGIDWDEGPVAGGDYGPYFQSKKIDRYKEVLAQLQEKGRVYEVHATEEEIGERVAKFKESKQYSAEKEKELIHNLRTFPAYKFKAEKKDYTFNDLIKGEITVEADTIEELVLFKSDGMPTYNFAVVVDDIDMKITHVVRGDDHISNTPKQLMIYEALGVEPPLFGHMGMILAKDDETGNVSKMSKRHGATSITDYKEAGYLPEALFNYISFLGWAPGNDQEIFSKEELIKEFTLERVSKSPSIFDRDKLNWFNQQYLMKMEPASILELAKPYFASAGLDLERFNRQQQENLIDLARKRVNLLSELPSETDYFFSTETDYSGTEQQEMLQQPESRPVLEYAVKTLQEQADWTPEALKDFLKKAQKELNLKTRQVMMPVRIALSGKMHGADLFMIIHIMGKETAIKRLQNCLSHIS